MKTKYLVTLLIMVLGLKTTIALAPPGKAETKQFLARTNKVLISSHSALKKSKKFTGNYTLAVRHQQYAKKMYIRNQFQRAINHSRRARMLALKVIRENSGQVPAEASFTKAEYTQMGSNFPTDRELDDAIAMDGQHNLKDEDIIDKDLDLTLP